MALNPKITNDKWREIGFWIFVNKTNGFDEFERSVLRRFLNSYYIYAEEAQMEIERNAAEEIDLGHFDFEDEKQEA